MVHGRVQCMDHQVLHVDTHAHGPHGRIYEEDGRAHVEDAHFHDGEQTAVVQDDLKDMTVRLILYYQYHYNDDK